MFPQQEDLFWSSGQSKLDLPIFLSHATSPHPPTTPLSVIAPVGLYHVFMYVGFFSFSLTRQYGDRP